MDLPEADLIEEIEAFCERTGLSAHAVGKGALNDSAFMHTLKDGRELRRATRQKVRQFMAEYVAQAAE